MTLEDMLREAYASGAQVHLWPEHFGQGACATVRSRLGDRHVVNIGNDPVTALKAALTEMERQQRERAAAGRPDPRQTDLEDAIAAVGDGDDFEGLL